MADLVFSYKTYRAEIAAGASFITGISGTYFSVLSATQDSFGVGLNGLAVNDFAPGMKVRAPVRLEQLQIVNRSGSAVLELTYAVGDGDLDDSRLGLVGAVLVNRAAGNSFADDGAVSVGTAATALLAANGNRTRAVIRAGAADLWLGGAGVTAAGVPTVAAGGELEIFHTNPVYGIRAAGTVDAGTYEEERV